MSSQTDVSGVASAVSRIQIDGPGAPPTTTARVELNEESALRVLPGELDSAVGSQPQPAPERDDAGDDILFPKIPLLREDDEPDTEEPEPEPETDEPEQEDYAQARVEAGPITIDLDAPDADAQIKDAAREVVRRAIPPALFDVNEYGAGVNIDGQEADELVIAFSGSIKAGAGDAAILALFERMRLGKWVDLNVGGVVSAKAGGYKEDKEGASTVTGRATVKVTDLRVLRPEDLS